MDWRSVLGSALSNNYVAQLDPTYFAELPDCFDDDILFLTVPSGTTRPLGSKLLGARRVPIKQRRDLYMVLFSCARFWLRVADPAAPARKCPNVALLSSSSDSYGAEHRSFCVLWELSDAQI